MWQKVKRTVYNTPCVTVQKGRIGINKFVTIADTVSIEIDPTIPAIRFIEGDEFTVKKIKGSRYIARTVTRYIPVGHYLLKNNNIFVKEEE